MQHQLTAGHDHLALKGALTLDIIMVQGVGNNNGIGFNLRFLGVQGGQPQTQAKHKRGAKMAKELLVVHSTLYPVFEPCAPAGPHRIASHWRQIIPAVPWYRWK